MTKCQFEVGETVVYFPDGTQDRSSGAGIFRIRRFMPDEQSGPSYKIKHLENGHERIAREYQLELAGSEAASNLTPEVITPPLDRPKRNRRKAQPRAGGFNRSSSMVKPHCDAKVEQVMATVRRLRAAVSASEAGIAEEAVAGEILKMLDSDGLRNLLAHSEPSLFVRAIKSASKAVGEGGSSAEILNRLRAILGSQVLTAALATDGPDEQPSRLLQLMLDGPFRQESISMNDPNKEQVGSGKQGTDEPWKKPGGAQERQPGETKTDPRPRTNEDNKTA